MKVLNLHRWDVSIKEARQIQINLSKRLIFQGEPKKITVVAGSDVSYNQGDQKAWAGVVVFNIQDWEVVEERVDFGTTPFPYIPGYLSFREVPVLLKVFQKVETVADVVLLDGQGIAHPRRMGIASHVGLFLELPTIGCAKSRLVGEFEPVPKQKGSYSVLKVDDERVGWVVRTRDRVKPIFISPGHRIGSERTLKVVMECCGTFRIPEPLRRAHQLVNRIRKGTSL